MYSKSYIYIFVYVYVMRFILTLKNIHKLRKSLNYCTPELFAATLATTDKGLTIVQKMKQG